MGTLRLCDPLRLERRASTAAATRWRMESRDPMALYVLERRIRGEEWSQIVLPGGCGPCRDGARENFGEMLSVSDFLNTFDLSLDDLRNSIKMLE